MRRVLFFVVLLFALPAGAVTIDWVTVADPGNTPDTNEVDGGITRSGTSGSFTYSVKDGFANEPVNHVSFHDAIALRELAEQRGVLHRHSCVESGLRARTREEAWKTS